MNRLLRAAVMAAGLVFASNSVVANVFKLEKTSVILNESDGEVAFSVKNTGDEPILLISRVDDLPGRALAERVLVSPSITRVEPGDTQAIRFSLKPGVTMTEEALIKASFESIGQAPDSQVKMPLRQEIGFLIHPKSVPVVPEPWADLRWHVEGNELVIANSGKHVVRLAPQVKLIPSLDVVPTAQFYIRPGETLRKPLPDTARSVEAIEIAPMSRYAFALPSVRLPAAD